MKTVKLDVRSPKEAMSDIAAILKSGKAQKAARISFATPELLWKVLTAKRWELYCKLSAEIRELADKNYLLRDSLCRSRGLDPAFAAFGFETPAQVSACVCRGWPVRTPLRQRARER